MPMTFLLLFYPPPSHTSKQGKENELAEVLAHYYEVHDKDRNFMQWAIQNEVNRTGKERSY